MMLPTFSLVRPVALFGALALSPARPLTQQPDTVVRMAGAPKYAGVSTLVEEVSIGVVDGAEEYVFGDVGDIAVGKDGSIYVLDRQIYGIRMYDKAGKYVRTIGRRGQGPGEIMSPSGIAVHPDGRLLVWDTGLWRVNVYSATGVTLTQWPLATAGSGTAMMSRAILTDTSGATYLRKSSFGPANDGSRARLRYVWLRLRADGSIADTVAEPRWPRAQRSLDAVAGNMSKSAALPFDPSPVWTISPLGDVVSGLPDRYAFEMRARNGSIISIRRDVQPTPIPDAVRDSARRAVEASLRETQPNWSWSGPDVPRIRPFYEGLVVGLDGRVWISRVREQSPTIGNISNASGSAGRSGGPPARRSDSRDRPPVKRTPALYDVFEPSGAFIGQVQIPPGVSTVIRRGDYVWGVAYNDDDVAFVKRYRIVWK